MDVPAWASGRVRNSLLGENANHGEFLRRSSAGGKREFERLICVWRKRGCSSCDGGGRTGAHDVCMNAIPEGYGPLPRSSNFLQMVGPLFCKPDGDSLILGLRIDERHANSRGIAHGGLLTTLADLALGYNCGRMMAPNQTLITTSITIDFVASASIGDWLAAYTDVQQTGRRLGFANCYLTVGDKRIARASGIFSVIDRKVA